MTKQNFRITYTYNGDTYKRVFSKTQLGNAISDILAKGCEITGVTNL